MPFLCGHIHESTWCILGWLLSTWQPGRNIFLHDASLLCVWVWLTARLLSCVITQGFALSRAIDVNIRAWWTWYSCVVHTMPRQFLCFTVSCWSYICFLSFIFSVLTAVLLNLGRRSTFNCLHYNLCIFISWHFFFNFDKFNSCFQTMFLKHFSCYTDSVGWIEQIWSLCTECVVSRFGPLNVDTVGSFS